MTYVVDFMHVSPVGLETSPVVDALAGLRANEARYYWNKYHHQFAVEPASETPEALAYVNDILASERQIVLSATPLETSRFEVADLQMTYVFYQDGLGLNVMYSRDDPKRRAVGFKLSLGMDVPAELAGFKFARQRSKLAGEIRGSYFVIKGQHDWS